MVDRAEKRVKKSLAYFTGLILLIVSIAGCAGTQQRPPVAPAPSAWAQAKLAEADKSLEAAKRQVASFHADLDTVVARVEELRRRPYWSGFERVLLKYPALTDPNGGAEITPEVMSHLSGWSRESNVPWEEVLRDYSRLVDRCAILEMKRVAARQTLISVQAAYMAVVMREEAAGNQEKAKKIYSLVNSLDKPGAELDSIRLDRLGLYVKGRQKSPLQNSIFRPFRAGTTGRPCPGAMPRAKIFCPFRAERRLLQEAQK